jgi:catechol 2,3-dioxygenase-like lactoylglutathione lyase family enzyme
MPIVLNHTIVNARDRHVAAAFFADLLGLEVSSPAGPFVPVQVNDELTFDFDDRHGTRPGHYAFHVDDVTFDGVVRYLGEHPQVEFGSGRAMGWDSEIDDAGGRRTVYVRDPNGHSYEFFTAVPD